jgi:hypothetical protein
MNPIYIFDLDGTLALIDHRRPLVEAPYLLMGDMANIHTIHDDKDSSRYKFVDGIVYQRDPKFKPDWNAFYEACYMDLPNLPVIRTLQQLYAVGNDIRIWSARDDMVEAKTIIWLVNQLGYHRNRITGMLRMRPNGDSTPDEKLKQKWLNLMNPQERQCLTAVFDDRQKVVDMWRKNGVACFQVAPGDF